MFIYKPSILKKKTKEIIEKLLSTVQKILTDFCYKIGGNVTELVKIVEIAKFLQV